MAYEIRIKITDAQNATIEQLVEEHPDHDAWIDFVSTDDDGTVWLMFTTGHNGFYAVINADGEITNEIEE